MSGTAARAGRGNGAWHRVSDRKRRELHYKQIEATLAEVAKRGAALEQFVFERMGEAWNTLVERFGRLENRLDVSQAHVDFQHRYIMSLLPTPEDKAGYLAEREAFLQNFLADRAEAKQRRLLAYQAWRMCQEISMAALVDKEQRQAAAVKGVQVMCREITSAAKTAPKNRRAVA